MEQINPDHYKAQGKECIVEMYEKFGREAVIAFCNLNAFKYLYRANHKGQRQSDLDKASWYNLLGYLLEQGDSIHEALETVRKGGAQ